MEAAKPTPKPKRKQIWAIYHKKRGYIAQDGISWTKETHQARSHLKDMAKGIIELNVKYGHWPKKTKVVKIEI